MGKRYISTTLTVEKCADIGHNIINNQLKKIYKWLDAPEEIYGDDYPDFSYSFHIHAGLFGLSELDKQMAKNIKDTLKKYCTDSNSELTKNEFINVWVYIDFLREVAKDNISAFGMGRHNNKPIFCYDNKNTSLAIINILESVVNGDKITDYPGINDIFSKYFPLQNDQNNSNKLDNSANFNKKKVGVSNEHKINFNNISFSSSKDGKVYVKNDEYETKDILNSYNEDNEEATRNADNIEQLINLAGTDQDVEWYLVTSDFFCCDVSQ